VDEKEKMLDESEVLNVFCVETCIEVVNFRLPGYMASLGTISEI